MKLTIFILACCVLLSVAVYADSVDDFVNSVNTNWSSTNYSAILYLIDGRLATNATDTLALGMKMSFYEWGVVDLIRQNRLLRAFLSQYPINIRKSFHNLVHS